MCLPLPKRFEKKNICSFAHQRGVRSKTGISLGIISNVFKCLIVSLVPLIQQCYGVHNGTK